MHVIEAMSALAQPTRLEVFTQLARSRPDGLSSGALAERVGTLPNTMSTHLTILSRAGLVSATKAGRQIIYKAEPNAIRDLVLFLMNDCCPGRVEVTDPADHPDCCCGPGSGRRSATDRSPDRRLPGWGRSHPAASPSRCEPAMVATDDRATPGLV